MAVFYAAGHGFQLGKDDSLVLLSEFAKPNRGVLHGAMDVGSVYRAMSNPRAARIQFYFVDACRVKPKLFRDYLSTRAGVTLDVGDVGAADAAPIFFSAAPRTLALAEPGKGTLFCQALLDCLALHAVEGPDGQNRWSVSTTSLSRRLKQRVAELAREHGEEQTTVPGGLPADEVFHVLREVPNVPLRLTLKPQEASGHASAKLWTGQTGTVAFDGERFTPVLEREVPAGYWVLDVTIAPGVAGFRSRNGIPIPLLPPKYEDEIEVAP
jgi:hypothetical protein